MNSMNPDHDGRLPEERICPLGDGVAEVALLLPRRHLAALERIACSRGQTLGQLIRLVIHAYLTSPGQPDRGSAAPR
jgi:hypothetical protein